MGNVSALVKKMNQREMPISKSAWRDVLPVIDIASILDPRTNESSEFRTECPAELLGHREKFHRSERHTKCGL